MSELFWRVFAWVVSRERVANYLIERAKRTPYYNLPGYMNRDWLFNGYDIGRGGRRHAEWLPSIRIHHILRADHGRDLHDHPWDARTIVLRNGYTETRRVESGPVYVEREFTRRRGDTATLNYGEYHRIDKMLGEGPTVTMFITWKYLGTWGFLVNGVKVPHREYKGEQP